MVGDGGRWGEMVGDGGRDREMVGDGGRWLEITGDGTPPVGSAGDAPSDELHVDVEWLVLKESSACACHEWERWGS